MNACIVVLTLITDFSALAAKIETEPVSSKQKEKNMRLKKCFMFNFYEWSSISYLRNLFIFSKIVILDDVIFCLDPLLSFFNFRFLDYDWPSISQ